MSFMVDNKEDLPVPQSDAPMQILIGPEKRERRPEGEQRGHRQLRYRRQYARAGGRGRTDLYGIMPLWRRG